VANIASQVSHTKIGGYHILEKIGKGGMGLVYKAQDPITRAVVAVKVVTGPGASDPTLRMRFAQECQTARKLDHPNAVKVLDFGLDGSKPYLVMEFVDGESVGARLERDGPLPEAEAVRLIVQVGNALHFAHQRKIIHRDVKPDNILVAKDGTAKLTDLGLAKSLDSDLNLTRTLSSMGTPNFMAPEQFEDAKRAEPRSDLYSLAATLYQMVTGELPFKARSVKAFGSILQKKVANEIVPPRQLVPALSERLEAEILRALRADRNERPATVQEFVETLTAGEGQAPTIPTNRRGGRGATKTRTKQRFPAASGTACRPLQRLLDRTWQGRVKDISEGGVCLQLKRRFEPGSFLTVLVDDARVSRRILVAQVVWVKKEGAEFWKMGCKFHQPLCEFEVNEFRLAVG
jgi:serine/threonine protein kinase